MNTGLTGPTRLGLSDLQRITLAAVFPAEPEDEPEEENPEGVEDNLGDVDVNVSARHGSSSGNQRAFS